MNRCSRSFGLVIFCNSRVYFFFLLTLAMSLPGSVAKADTLNLGGTLSSDSAAVSPTDPVITNPLNVVFGSPLSMTLTYDPFSYTQSSNTYVFTNATFLLSFDSYSFYYSSSLGNYIAISFPGAYGAGTVSFQICTSASACSDAAGDFLNLYYSGTVTSLSSLSAQAGALTGYPSASPAQFEFLRNFSDFSQTDLQGTLTTPTSSPVPEPSSLVLLVLPAIGIVLKSFRRQAGPISAAAAS